MQEALQPLSGLRVLANIGIMVKPERLGRLTHDIPLAICARVLDPVWHSLNQVISV